jgi:hypothetical protein
MEIDCLGLIQQVSPAQGMRDLAISAFGIQVAA